MPAEGVLPQGRRSTRSSWAPGPTTRPRPSELLKEAGYPNGFETDALVGLQPHDRAEGDPVRAAAAGSRSASRCRCRRSKPASASSSVESCAGPGHRAGAHVLRRLVVVDRRSRLGDASAAVRRNRSRRSSSTPRTTRTTRSTPTSRRRWSRPTRPTRRRSTTTRRKRIWKDAPWAFLVTEQLLSAHASNLSGLYVIPDGSFNFDEVGTSK